MRIAAIAVLNPCLAPKEQHSYKPSNVCVNNTIPGAGATYAAPAPLQLSTKGSEFSWTSLKYDAYSTRDHEYCYRPGRLGKKWEEYQGSKDWEGLLDPLDDSLRGEILRYGQFVVAAYKAFDFDLSSPSYGTSKFSRESMFYRAGMGETTGYRVVKNLDATCGIQLPGWIDRAPSWMSRQRQSNWIGYVAVCEDEEEIARLGRRDVVISFRGTGTCLEWMENLRATLTSLPGDMAGKDEGNGGAMVQSGFLSLYTSSTDTCPSLQTTVKETIAKVLKKYGDEPLSITITGHSLGAALAKLAAYDIKSNFPNAPMVTVLSFGGPRVGNQNFRSQLEKSGTKVLRIVNSDDLITKVPGFVVDDNDMATDKRSTGANVAAGLPAWLQKRMEEMQWGYADVGQELRMSSRDCPYLSKGNVATCHELSTYLELVNGFVSSTCPFRAESMSTRERLERLVEV